MIRLKRIYDAPGKEDGFRILVDRLWPRGLSKGRARVDLWLKDVAPSDALRRWFGHDPAKWGGFKKKYAAELKGRKGLLKEIRGIERREGRATLLFSAKDRSFNNAVALPGFLKK